MISNVRREALLALLQSDPRAHARRLLGIVLRHSNCTAGGIFEASASSKLPLCVGQLDQSGLDRTHEIWKTRRAQLLAGQPVTVDGRYLLAPVRSEDDKLVGLLYLESDSPIAPAAQAAITAVAPLIAAAIEAKAGLPEQSFETQLVEMNDDQVTRVRLERALRMHEWNIAAAARALNVTRRTIYNRLERFRIDRERILKGRPPKSRA